ncbi:MAG: tRNA (adenosine(37)-N6)-threonylcarbamoyltransferase complex transferase subunit TsaD [Verrucomicrobia bacterium]|nr:tRNA (adenosine(37)-N6)-threonylcarbamoyltransferase complex transferase subunit TsaD [Verrucomicrobiota bacterium]MDA1087523.1 tRNA (adenosine(37)-N6)-threonylcarbamoyltransferase complex transferase subunit TsaD [Verrucomicrobiota bacterium]
MNVLGIETSCDETAASVVRDGRHVLSNVILSQIAQHAPYGGVVPEIAARSHVEYLPGVIEQAVAGAGLRWSDIDTVAVTYGPGLASSLLVGLSAAKALAQRLGRPLVAINHLEAHLYSIFLDPDLPGPNELCPLLVLLVSGGHSCLVRMTGLGEYQLLGQTVDDAAGEAFDKGATLLGLGYPGGPEVQRVSVAGDPTAVRFPRGRPTKPVPARSLRQAEEGGPRSSAREALDPNVCFSFSGLKTALLYYMRDHPDAALPDVAASYQEAIVDSLVDRTRRALNGDQCLAAVGGVALNARLRDRLGELAEDCGLRYLPAGRAYCTDNAAMIAGLAGAGRGVHGDAAMGIDARPNLGL